MVKVIVHGCLGKMGKVLTQSIYEEDGFTLVAGVSKEKLDNISYPLYENILQVKEKADVLIDFSRPEPLKDLLTYAKTTKTPLVIATTGYSDEALSMICETAKIVPIFHSSNMSLGINLLLKLVTMASKALNNFDVEIIEKHHNKKIDAPSGTAIMIANEIKKNVEDAKYNYGRYGKDTKRKEMEIGIHAVRGGTIVGDHAVLFAGKDEMIEINHTALSKEVFAQGAMKAAKFIINKEAGYYNMKDMIN